MYSIDISLKIVRNDIELLLLDHANLEIHPGDFIVLSAGNGMGKTSFLETLTYGFYNKEVLGHVKIRDHQQNVYSSLATRTAFMEQEMKRDLKLGTVMEYVFHNLSGVMSTASLKSLKRSGTIENEVSSLMTYFFYDDYFKTQKYDLNTRINKFSVGETQVISFIANVIRAKYVDLFILDEPFKSASATNKKKLNNALIQFHQDYPDQTIVLVTHCNIVDLSVLQRARIVTIQEHKLLEIKTPYQQANCLGTTVKGLYEIG